MEPSFVADVLVAVLLGTAIGLERQFGAHPAGLRTNALVCAGAALFVGLSRLLLARDGGTPPPLAAQVVSGIGFLGGGVILREGLSVRGMNTAATLWCSAAVGSLAGAGFRPEAAVGAAVVVGVHLTLRPLVHVVDRWTKGMVNVDTTYELRVVCAAADEGVVRQIVLRHVNSVAWMQAQGLAVNDTDNPDRKAVVAEIVSSRRDDRRVNDLVSRLSVEPAVSAVGWQRKG